jgi:hypothetical protein
MKKVSQFEEQVSPMPDEQMQEESATQKFDLSSLVSFIDSDPQGSMEFLQSQVSDGLIETPYGPAEALEMLEAEKWKYANPATKGKIAGEILEMLPAHMKTEDEDMSEGNTFQAKKREFDVAASVEASNAELRKAVKDAASKSDLVSKTANSKYNLRKQAQSASIGNSILYGPEGFAIDPGTHQHMNQWHIVERNKGWGLMPNHLFSRIGIDYETFWREHIMDRYYREYRDKDGKWGGGYLDRRFETDKNIPDENNMQLRPGQVRKPYVPEHGLTEARLESERIENGVEGAKVFNWREANSSRGMNKSSSHDHYRIVCPCGNTIEQCRCSSDSKRVTVASGEFCLDCQKKKS